MAIINTVIVGSGGIRTDGSFKPYSLNASNYLSLGTRISDTTSSSLPAIITQAVDVSSEALYRAFEGNTNIVGALDLSNLTNITGYNACSYAFGSCSGITSVDLSNVQTVTGYFACLGMFSNCSNITSFDLSGLTEVSGSVGGCSSMFARCTGITTANLSNLEKITSQGGTSNMFDGCTALASVDLSSLNDLTGSGHMQGMFSGCTALTSLSFPALTTSSFDSRTTIFVGMCNNIPNITIHFPASVQSIIESMQGYSTTAPFGAISGTVLFDL